MPHRYFTTEIHGDRAFLSGADARHLAVVMRARPGLAVTVCDTAGTDYACRVCSAAPEQVELEVISSCPSVSEPSVPVTLYVGYPKQDKLEWIIQKAVELGAGRIVFFTSRYSAEEKFNLRRVEKIAAEACKQCGRSRLVAIDFVEGFEKALDMCTAERVVMPYERAVGGNMHEALSGSGNCAVDLIIGSEGGFSEEEALLAKEHGARLISLGKRILRCETAAAVALALVQYERGQLGA